MGDLKFLTHGPRARKEMEMQQYYSVTKVAIVGTCCVMEVILGDGIISRVCSGRGDAHSEEYKLSRRPLIGNGVSRKHGTGSLESGASTPRHVSRASAAAAPPPGISSTRSTDTQLSLMRISRNVEVVEAFVAFVIAKSILSLSLSLSHSCQGTRVTKAKKVTA